MPASSTKGIWRDEDAASLPAYKPTPIEWKRPFEARWRGDFIVAKGQRLADWPTRNQSFDFKSTANAQSGADPLDAPSRLRPAARGPRTGGTKA